MPPRSRAFAAVDHDRALEAFLTSMPLAYRQLFDEGSVEMHAGIVQRRGASAVHVEVWRELPERVVALCVVADDAPGLLSRISAALVAHDVDVVAAQAYCRRRRGTAAEAVDFFWVRRVAPVTRAVVPVRAADIASFAATLDALVRGRANFENAVRLARAVRGAGDATRVRFERDEHEGTMVLSIQAGDRPGLLLLVTEALFRARVQIARSDVSTRDGRALDRFHLTELDGAPLKQSRVLGIQTAVLAAIEQSRRVTGDGDP